MDLRPTKKKRTSLVVELKSYRRYVPGSGPPLRPITLLPPRDSTAYILNKLVLPLSSETKETTQRRMHYLVGWKDLPAARAVIPATKILDYVSPAELEDWEYNDLLRREEEREKYGDDAAPLAGPRKRPGRRPKARMIEPPAEAPLLSAAEEAMLAQKAASGPSLSTPKKRTLQELIEEEQRVDETGDDMASDDADIRQQPTLEEYYEEHEHGMDVMELDEPTVRRFPGDEAEEDLLTRRDTSRSSSSLPPTSQPHSPSATAGRRRKDKGKEPIVDMKVGLLSKSFKRTENMPFPAPPSSAPGGASSPASRPVIRDSHVGPHRISPSRGPSWNAMPNAISQPTFTQLLRRARSPFGARTEMSSFSHHNGHTAGKDLRATTPAKPSQSLTPVDSAMPMPARISGFTPAGSSSQPRHSTPLAAASIPSSADIKARTPSRSALKAKAPKKAMENETQWEVKRVLDDRRRYDEKNRLVHEYKVLWEGNWPPEQNPTWEPESNLPKDLVKKYHQKREAGNQGKTRKTSSPFLPQRRFSNVAEAFAGVLDEDNDDTSDDREEMQVTKPHDSDGEEEKLRVVEDQHSSSPLGIKNHTGSPGFGAFDSSIAKYRKTFSGDFGEYR